MALLTQSEAVAFNGFLSSVDFSDVLEWSTVTAVDGNILIPPAPEKGKEAVLAKAAKDLMSLESNVQTQNVGSFRSSHDPGATTNPSWPSLPGDTSSEQRRTHSYTYGFGPPSRNSHKLHLPNANPPGGPSQAIPENLFSLPRSQSPTRTTSSSPYSFKSSSTPSNDVSFSPTVSRPTSVTTSSASSALSSKRPPSTKRSLPHDPDTWPEGPTRPADSSKRRRSSAAAASTSPTEDRQPPPSARSRATRASSTSSSTVAGPSSATPDAELAGSNVKPALLSPSQKRANHIQSEQKRRANIRRGYEALCEAVPALREAIRLEEESARVIDEEAQGRTKRKRKGKGAATLEDSAEKVVDGRAGPKSENVVLSKTIDHLNALLSEQSALKARLQHAQNVLPRGHPALATSSDHLDDKGVPLWEREWNGGAGWKDGEDDADEE